MREPRLEKKTSRLRVKALEKGARPESEPDRSACDHECVPDVIPKPPGGFVSVSQGQPQYKYADSQDQLGYHPREKASPGDEGRFEQIRILRRLLAAAPLCFAAHLVWCVYARKKNSLRASPLGRVGNYFLWCVSKGGSGACPERS